MQTLSQQAVTALAPARPNPHLEAALAHAHCGFDVFPIAPNSKKPPLIENWQNRATGDERQIREWWKRWPDANIGICTSGRMVVDIDPDKGGKEAFMGLLEQMRMLGEPTPATWTSRTRSGGAHLFFTLPRGATVANSVEHIGVGVDVRGDSGYVVAPGSTVGDGTYEWKEGYRPTDRPMAEAPAWLLDLAKRPLTRNANSGVRIIEEDDIALARADEWLRRFAPEAIQGGRDHTAFKVAARLYDEGIARESCMERLLSWNETHCHPPLELDEIERVVWSAQKNRANAIGAKHPVAAGFEPVAIKEWAVPAEPSDAASCIASPLQRFDAAAIPAVPWVVPGLAVRRAITTVTGPGGTSKSTWTLQLAMALATGRSDICGFEMPQPSRVWLWNQEDDLEEMQRRLAAIMAAFEVSWADLEDEAGRSRFFLNSGVGNGHRLSLAKRAGDTAIAGDHLKAMASSAAEVAADLIILDPLVSLHQSPENDNNQMRAVFDLIGSVAVDANCAVLVVSHTGKPDKASSKGFAGDAYAGRGASSQPDAARAALTFMPMAEGDMKNWRLPPAESHLDYVRLDDAKMNLGRKRREPRWFRHDQVLIAGFKGGNGHVLRPVALEPAVKIRETDKLHAIAKAIHDHLGPNTPHTIQDILKHLKPADAAPLAEQKNRTRRLDDMFGGAGISEYLTEFGMLRRTTAKGSRGTSLTLSAITQCLNGQSEALLNG